MKNILVPTDFSACAADATYVSFQLAQKFGARVHLYHNIDTTKQWGLRSLQEDQLEQEKQQQLENANTLFQDWKLRAAEVNITIDASVSTGPLVKELEKKIEELGIDFIVMGSHGASGKNEFFIGSNAQRIIRMLHLPILVIKEPVEEFKIEKVLFASNFAPVDQKAFQYLLDFVKPFQPEMHLLEVNTSSWFSQPYLLVDETMNDFKAMCGNLSCKTYFRRDWNVDAGIRQLTEEIGIDLIAISNINRHPLKRIFAGSNVEAVANHADKAVLSIDFPPGQ